MQNKSGYDRRQEARIGADVWKTQDIELLWEGRVTGLPWGSVCAVETRWLTTDEQVAWRRFVAVIGLLQRDIDAAMRENNGIHMHEYWVLAMLSEAPEHRLRMQELARRSTASASRLSHTIKRLEQRGWVIRQQSSSDGRGQSAVLTEAGFDFVKQAAPSHVDEVRRLFFDALSTDEVTQLSHMCDEVLKQLDPTGERSPGGRL